jgi:hypothetical protein
MRSPPIFCHKSCAIAGKTAEHFAIHRGHCLRPGPGRAAEIDDPLKLRDAVIGIRSRVH